MTTDRSSENRADWTSNRLIEQRERICARFEEALRSSREGDGDRPRSEDFLADVPESHRWPVLHCLLLLEEDYRRQAGEAGSLLGEFCERFPDFASCIKQAFPGQDFPTATQIEFSTARGLRKRVREYELQEKLGQGGMGVVWKAWHVRLKKHRAIKVLHSHLLESPEVRDRFLNEMEALARFEHANIVRAHDAFEEGGQLYLVMEYVEGSDVSRLVTERKKLAVGAACEIVRQAAQGLAVLHDQHVTHRDIKPSNLMLARDPDSNRPVVKVMDLGLSQIDTERGLTNSGEVFGTCEFMAPEQYEDCHDLTPAADVYSLGCSLFFLLTGQPPYTAEGSQGARAIKLMLAHQNEPIPRLRDFCPEGASLQPLLDRMLAKKAEKRFASALELLPELKPFADQEQLKTILGEKGGEVGDRLPDKKRRRPVGRLASLLTRRAVIWMIAALALVAGSVGGIAGLYEISSRPRLRELHLHAASVAIDYGNQIERRLAMLRRAAGDPRLPGLLLATKDAEIRSKEFSELNQWLEDEKLGSGLTSLEQDDTTWFITDASGRQVAREPHGSSLGGSQYWTRSYFHGMPNDLDAEADDPAGVSPVREQTVSAPYSSTSEPGQWKIALSTPIFAPSSESGEPIGILSMSVKLEDLTWFQSGVENSAVALVELYRENWLDDDSKGQIRIGQIIYHTGLSRAALGGKNSDADPPCVAEELVPQLQTLRKQRLNSFLRKEPRSLCDLCVSKTYRDPVSANPTSPRRAAFEPVFVSGEPGSKLTNIGWLVIVHDFYPSDRPAN
ncbi:MAG: protein kinase [Planctomycetaceae bacterium]|nr:protein kinase [Planctomycetaceae bacterium]